MRVADHPFTVYVRVLVLCVGSLVRNGEGVSGRLPMMFQVIGSLQVLAGDIEELCFEEFHALKIDMVGQYFEDSALIGF